MPGPTSQRKSSRGRKERASRAVSCIAAPLDVEANRHPQVALLIPLDGLQQSRAQRGDQPQQQLIAPDALDAVLQELGVEADLKRLALEGGRHALLRIADLGCLRG